MSFSLPKTTGPDRKAWQFLEQADGGKVLITLSNGDRFGLPVDDVIRACRSQEEIKAFAQQVWELLGQLHDWLSERAAEVEKALFAIEPAGVVLVVVRKDRAFNPEFEDALSALDLGVAGDELFGLIRLRVLALPYSSDATIASFLNTSACAIWHPSS